MKRISRRREQVQERGAIQMNTRTAVALAALVAILGASASALGDAGRTVAGGGSHSLLVNSDGSVSAWGANEYGQLGDGTTIDSVVPVRVSNLTGVTAIAAGWYHNLAVKGDGMVWVGFTIVDSAGSTCGNRWTLQVSP